jgi:hypothetical protein
MALRRGSDGPLPDQLASLDVKWVLPQVETDTSFT